MHVQLHPLVKPASTNACMAFSSSGRSSLAAAFGSVALLSALLAALLARGWPSRPAVRRPAL